MPTEQQRTAMLAAMGIDVYRLREAANEPSRAVQIFIDAQARVCVSGAGDEAALAWLPSVLRIPAARVYCGEVEGEDTVTLDGDKLPRDAAGKRRLWQALKPLAHRLHNPT